MRLADIDSDWLAGLLDGAGFEDFQLLSCEAVGHGTTADVVRLHLVSQVSGQPHSLIAKLPRLQHVEDPVAASIYGYGREAQSYRFFGEEPPCRIPLCYAAADEAGGHALILEDMAEDCSPGDQIAGCGVKEADAVVRELAGLHARYRRSGEIEALDWPNRRWRNATRSLSLFANGATAIRERYAESLGEAPLGVIDAVVPLISDWSAVVSFEPTLIHADPRVDNIIFEQRSEGIRACLIDLQSISVGDGAYDLAYFLTGSLDPEARASCERTLVAWHATQMRKVEPSFSDDKAWLRYRQCAISGLAGTVGAAGLLPGGEHVNALLIALLRRNCAAIIALDGLVGARSRIEEHRLQ
ncbi:MAG: phosphotransferase [Novosphingobium sp.]|nr:phosphotransferase [Novosphingobium sp.]